IDRVWFTHHFTLQAGARYMDGGGHTLSFGLCDGREDLRTTGRYFDTHLRINHYNLRDESFYVANRLTRARAGRLPGKSLERLLEHYDSFGKVQDWAILDFLKGRHSASYEAFWGSRGAR